MSFKFITILTFATGGHIFRTSLWLGDDIAGAARFLGESSVPDQALLPLLSATANDLTNLLTLIKDIVQEEDFL